VDIQFIGKEYGPAEFEPLQHQADAGEVLDMVWIVVFGYQFGALPHPADLVEPTPHRLRRDRDPPFGLQCQGQRGATPARAAPSKGAGVALSSATRDRFREGVSTVVRRGGSY